MTRVANTYTYLTGKIIRESEKAILFKYAGTAHWFPLSQLKEIHLDILGEDGNYCDQIQASDWIIGQKGIEL